jgi:hypothetical protein
MAPFSQIELIRQLIFIMWGWIVADLKREIWGVETAFSSELKCSDTELSSH